MAQLPEWERLPDDQREAVQVVSKVFPFRTNEYVVRHLIDWTRVPEDPLFQLTFPQPEMLDPGDYLALRKLLWKEASEAELRRVVRRIRLALNPHPAGQMEHNVPTVGSRRLPGVQHKYRETVLYFPAPGQTCHAYCTYCFRLAQFVDLPEMRFQARQVEELTGYLRRRPEVSDVLVTGGDPLVMSAAVLRRHVEPLLASDLEHVRNVRLGTKALSYWPHRFVTDPDADDLLRLFEEVVDSGRHLAVMAHYSHSAELSTAIARKAVRRIRATGAEIRTQAPIIRHVNDRPEDWSELWTTQVRLGMVPYYAFVERDTGPRRYFELPLTWALKVFQDAYRAVSGLARTARGPSMSTTAGKVRIVGMTRIGHERVFVLEFLQARDPSWVGRPFFARFDPTASWFSDLRPAAGSNPELFGLGGEGCRSLPLVSVGGG